jgi:hypothetical protein
VQRVVVDTEQNLIEINYDPQKTSVEKMLETVKNEEFEGVVRE